MRGRREDGAVLCAAKTSCANTKTSIVLASTSPHIANTSASTSPLNDVNAIVNDNDINLLKSCHRLALLSGD